MNIEKHHVRQGSFCTKTHRLILHIDFVFKSGKYRKNSGKRYDICPFIIAQIVLINYKLFIKTKSPFIRQEMILPVR